MSTAREVITAALITELPSEHADVDTRAALIEAALIEHGHLTAPDAPVTREQIEDLAKWLARESRHPRYGGEGWKRILQSEADVSVAAAAATRHARTEDDARTTGQAERMIIDWLGREDV